MTQEEFNAMLAVGIAQGLPGSYYTSRYKSGEEIDRRLGNAAVPAVNDNLLDNAYFVGGGSQQGEWQFPINQRIKNEYVGGQHCIDRWINTSTGTVKLMKNGLVFTPSVMLDQRIEKSRLTAGQVVTASIFLNGELYSNTFEIGNGNWRQVPFGNSGLNMRCLTQENSYGVFGIFSTDSYDGTPIGAAKLEIGPVQTLAHIEGDTWVLNTIPNFDLEMIKCQRYQLQLSGGVDGYGVVAIGQANLTTNAYVIAPTGSLKLKIV